LKAIFCYVNRLFLIISLAFVLFAATASASDKYEAEVLRRVFTFQENYNPKVKDHSMQVYTKHYYETRRRNFLLWTIPSMYTIARGDRKFMSERYDKVTITGANSYTRKRQVYYTTIPHNRSTMSVLSKFSEPNLYSTTIYGDEILSPLCRENRHFYRYKISVRRDGSTRIDFRPLVGDNTQLVAGTAIVVTKTGRLLSLVMKGEHDLIDFYTTYRQGLQKNKEREEEPRYCKTDVTFKFLGNHIKSSFTSIYNCPKQLADSVDIKGDRKAIERLRPVRLTEEEANVYRAYDKRKGDEVKKEKEEEKEKKDTTKQQSALNQLKEFGMDMGDYLLSSHGTSSEKYNIHFSPVLQPQYISYSGSKGLSYKMPFLAEYYFNDNSMLCFHPTLGYNFKIKKFYCFLPLRYTYDKQHNNYVEASWDAGNRIGNSSVLDELRDQLGEIPELEQIQVDEFNDYKASLINSSRFTSWLRADAGLVYHRRSAVNKADMRRYGKLDVYQSLAPSVTLHLAPWHEGPQLSVNYERTIYNHHFDLQYERWEANASKMFKLRSMRRISLQAGAGLYSNRGTSYFLDFANFCMNNLEGGWDDPWTGDFQLLDSRLYNLSTYYVNSNICYESPLMFTSFIPLVGHYIERERLYWSGLLIDNARPYHEMGYGFSTPFFSFGLFASFHNLDIQRFGAKFTIEIFHRW